MRRSMTFDNRLEFHHWLLLEGTPEVEQLCEQYPAVAFEGGGHVFDMWIRWRDHREECRDVVPSWKFASTAGFPAQPPGWPALVAWARQRSYECCYITECELAVHSLRIQNWQYMLPLVKLVVESPMPSLEQDVLAQMGSAQDVYLGGLTQALRSEDAVHVSAVVANLLHRGKLTADLDQCPFEPNLLLRLNF